MAKAARDLPVIVVAESVSASFGSSLVARGFGYVDTAGNCHIELDGGRIVLHVEGRRRAVPRERSAPLRGPGYQALFAVLTHQDLRHATVRELESASGASRHAVAQLLARLRTSGALLAMGRSGHAWAPGRRATYLDRFVGGWGDVLRKRLTVGRFRLPQQTVEAAEAQIEAVLGDTDIAWGYGGAAAAMRMTGYYRGSNTILHVADWSSRLATRLRAAPDREGPLRVVQTMGTLDLVSPVPKTAHPLLVHAELADSPEQRERDAAAAVFDRFLGESDTPQP